MIASLDFSHVQLSHDPFHRYMVMVMSQKRWEILQLAEVMIHMDLNPEEKYCRTKFIHDEDCNGKIVVDTNRMKDFYRYMTITNFPL